jgi:ribonuclease BN (tRNA processing enzyme)
VRERQSVPGFDLAHGASLLVHDCQYADDEYPNRIGWGHSRLSDVLAFARLTEAQRLLIFRAGPGVAAAATPTAASALGAK